MKQESVRLHCDSQSAMHLAKNQVYHARTKHIDVWYHRVRDWVNSGEVLIEKVHTDENAADFLTKPVTTEKFRHCLKLLNLTSCWSSRRGSSVRWSRIELGRFRGDLQAGSMVFIPGFWLDHSDRQGGVCGVFLALRWLPVGSRLFWEKNRFFSIFTKLPLWGKTINRSLFSVFSRVLFFPARVNILWVFQREKWVRASCLRLVLVLGCEWLSWRDKECECVTLWFLHLSKKEEILPLWM